ncbi:MAG TPA: CHAP domain-containing protein [Ktedonobacteraceae bacterium]
MPSQDDRVGSGSGPQGPVSELKQHSPVSGPLFYKSNVVRTLLEPATERGLTPVSGPLSAPEAVRSGSLANIGPISRPQASLAEIAESPTKRVPVVIKASLKRPDPAPPPLPPDLHKKRRLQIKLLGVGLLVAIILLALFTATPLGHEIDLGNFSGRSDGSVLTGQNPGSSNPIAQATATAIYHRKTDGYDPSFYGSQLVGNGSNSLVWPLGQCTYWSNYEYHHLTGYWVSWNGNADQWVTGARQAGWNVSQAPHVPAIMVMMPDVQGSSGYGHVAVVESVTGNTVHTSNMNWWANGGGWNRVSSVDFTVGRGIYFVWHK